MTHPLAICLLTAFALMTIVWVISIPLKRVSIIDAFWGPGFLCLAVACWFVKQEDWSGQQWLLFGMVGAWAIRLGWHLSIRCFGDAEEDRRYAAMREKRDPGFWWKSLGIVFWLQAVILWAVALPLQFALTRSPQSVPAWLSVVAVCIWLIGLTFEAVGDWQLSRFRSNPENSGKVLDSGLWGLTRHPNYFGDFMVWWGFWLLSVMIAAPIWTVMSPLIMSAFLMKFSGAGLLEKDISERRPKYAEYIQTTNAFFPWPRQKSSS